MSNDLVPERSGWPTSARSRRGNDIGTAPNLSGRADETAKSAVPPLTAEALGVAMHERGSTKDLLHDGAFRSGGTGTL